MNFTKDMIESAGGDWNKARVINDGIEILRSQRVEILPLAGDLLRSKIAWKYAVLRQSLTYRLVDLADATVTQWEEGNTLACMVIARAFFETVAVLHFVERNARKALAAKDLARLDQLAMQATFGGRSDFWRHEGIETAISVLTALDQLSKDMPFAREFYESISEVSHPNSQGAHQFYSQLDEERIEVRFSRQNRSRAKILSHLMVALIGVPWSIKKLSEIDELIPEVANLQNPEG